MLSNAWLSRYGLLGNFNASVTCTGMRTGTGTWTTGVTAIALCTSCSPAKKGPHSESPWQFASKKFGQDSQAKKGQAKLLDLDNLSQSEVMKLRQIIGIETLQVPIYSGTWPCHGWT